MSRVLVAAAILFASLSMRGQEEAPEIVSTTIVPVVANVTGRNHVQWRTDVAVRNDQPADVDVILTLPAAPGEPFFFSTLGPGQSLALVDIVQNTFGLRETISPLIVHTLGSRSATVGATIYPILDGQLASPEFIPVSYGQPVAAVQLLPGLKLNDDFRSNIGFVNLGEQPVQFTLSLQRLEGRSIAVTSIVVGARELKQQALQTLFPLISEGDNFSLLIDVPNDNAYAYGSVIDNEDHNAIFVEPLRIGYGGLR